MKYTKISKRWKNDLHIPKPQDLKVATYIFFAFLSSWLLSQGIFINNIQSFASPQVQKQIYYDFLPFLYRNTKFSHRKVRESWRLFSGTEKVCSCFFCPNQNRLGSFSFRQNLCDGLRGTFP